MYHHESKSIDASHPAQHILAMQVVQLQAQGALSRSCTTAPGDGDGNTTTSSTTGRATEIATTLYGILWTDMPFLVLDMMDHWVQDGPGLTAAHRLNFSHFLAQLAAAGLVKDKLSSIALAALRDRLETPRALGVDNREDDDDYKSAKTMADLSIQDLLPIVQTWLQHAGTKIIQLADSQWQDCPADARAIGLLYRDDAVTTLKTASYRPERWIFWLRRLEAISHEARGRPEKSMAGVAEQAIETVDTMLNSLHESHSIVRSSFEALPPDASVKHKNVD